MKFNTVFFDCDGVLMFGNPFERLNVAVGISAEQDQAWVDEYYEGTLTYQHWTKNLETRYRQAHLTRDWFEELMDVNHYALNDEAVELLSYLHSNKVRTAIISSGIDYYVSRVADILKIPQWRSNALFHFDPHGNFERVENVAEDPQAKVIHLQELCQQMHIDPEEVIYVGDAANDLMAFEATKHGLLYRTENPAYESKAWKRINNLLEIKEILES